MKLFYILLVACLLVFAACTPEQEQALAENNVEVQDADNDAATTDDVTVAVDTNDNGVADVSVQNGDVVEVTVDLDDVSDGVPADVPTEGFCTPGETYTYDGDEGSVDAQIIGLVDYKGSEWCQATSTTVISSPVGDMNTETTYYFDTTYSEYWITTTVSGGALPAPQTTEVHLVDGEVAQ